LNRKQTNKKTTTTTTAHSQNNLHGDTYICISLKERNIKRFVQNYHSAKYLR